MSPWAKCFALCAAFLAGCATAASAAPVTIERIVAKVDQEIITLSELQDLVKEEVSNLARVYKGEEFERRRREMELRGLDALVENKLILRRAKSMGVTVGESELEQAVSSVTDRNRLTTQDFRKYLASQGMTLETYREKVRERLLVRKVESLDVALRVTVSDDEIAAYYKANPDLYREGEERRVQQIFFPTKEGMPEPEVEAQRQKAAAAHKEVGGGADFGETAKKVSQDPAAAQGGNLGFIKKGEVFPEFEAIIFSLKEGEVSQPMKTRAGFHIVKLLEIKRGKAISLESVSSKIRDQLAEEKRAKRRREWISELKRASFLEVHFDPQVQAVSAGATVDPLFRDVREQVTFKLVGVRLARSNEMVGKDRLFWAYGANQKDPRWKSEKVKTDDKLFVGTDEIGVLEKSQREFVNPDPSASLFFFEHNYLLPNAYLGRVHFADVIKEFSLKPNVKKLSLETDSKRVRLEFEVKVEKTRSIVADPREIGQ
ncbi:MAG: peptidylprolyl isomerase [Candidatus Tectomicrobia bacterium]|uniref:Peptidylprolyl isomerase n=1 Tax=Tectimicrobiota bacterium TaxID=2528274 RepID=A0A932I1M8_UNCTE|nr:peptidylprolyl isomerase [Candidatus Tectomicrobia bacterium]